MTSERSAGPELTARQAAALARGLSGGRRRGSRLAIGPGRSFWTDFHEVFVPWPPPDALRGDLRALSACIAFQASPTKEAVSWLYADDFTPAQLAALSLVEGSAALGWAQDTWPRLADELSSVAGGLEPATWEGVDALELAQRAVALAEGEDVGPVTPYALGRLPLRRRNGSVLGGVLRRAANRLRPIERLLERIAETLDTEMPMAGDEQEIGIRRFTVLPADETPTPDELRDGLPYPEWNATAQEYRDDFVTVRERPIEARGRPRPPRSDLEAWFAAPLDRRWQGRLQDGVDLDIDATVDSLIDRLAGQTPDERVYRERVRTERDAAFAILIDGSGSVARAELLEHELACADALVDAMDQAGERHAVFSFWSDSRFHVAVEVLQDFGDLGTQPSSAGIRPRRYTRLGAAIRHVTARVVAQPARRRAVLVLSDGVPFDEGYEGLYAQADVAKAIEEAERMDVAVFILSVGEREHHPLQELLPAELIRVADMQDLAPAIGDVHAKLAAA